MSVKKIGVIGGGQMGSGIAQVCALYGYEVTLFDTIPEALKKGMAGIERSLKSFEEKGKITSEEGKTARNNLKAGGSIKDFALCDLVIEAIIENFSAKEDLFKSLDSVCKADTIFASNTSSISITKMAAATKRPSQFVGIHFMNPVPIMKLVELIRGLQTSDSTYQAAVDLVAKIQKTSVLAIDSPGFIVNRILVPMVNEAIYLLQEGVKREDIDTAMKLGTNQPMGPLTLADFVGLDTLLYILRVLHNELGEDKYRPCPLLVKYVEAGWFGKKSGKGFYEYPA